MSTRARIDLSDFEETPPNKDPAKLLEISQEAGFPSRPANLPAAKGAGEGAPVQPGAFQRPARPSGNRHIAINVRVDPATAERLYALRDADPTRKRALADVIEEATQLLYDRQMRAGT